MDINEAGVKADELIAGEITRQDKMWGAANERADSTKGQLFDAGLSQALALKQRQLGVPDAFDRPGPFYPVDWSGFRDYGSDVANIVVVIAFLRQEVKRKIANGEDTTRKSRNVEAQPYSGDQPYVQPA